MSAKYINFIEKYPYIINQFLKTDCSYINGNNKIYIKKYKINKILKKYVPDLKIYFNLLNVNENIKFIIEEDIYGFTYNYNIRVDKSNIIDNLNSKYLYNIFFNINIQQIDNDFKISSNCYSNNTEINIINNIITDIIVNYMNTEYREIIYNHFISIIKNVDSTINIIKN